MVDVDSEQEIFSDFSNSDKGSHKKKKEKEKPKV